MLSTFGVCVLKHSHVFEGCWDQRHTTSVIHFCYDPLCVLLLEYWYSPSKIIKLRHWSSSLEFLNSKTFQDFFNVREVGLRWRKHDHAIKICISLFFYKKKSYSVFMNPTHYFMTFFFSSSSYEIGKNIAMNTCALTNFFDEHIVITFIRACR